MFRRSLVLLAVVATALSLAGLAAAAIVHVRVEGKTQTIFGGDRAARRPARTRSTCCSTTARAAEFYAHVTQPSFGPYVDQIGYYPGARRDRLGLQGERRLAAGRRRPGAAEGRRQGALVLRAVRRRPAARRRSLSRARRRAATARPARTTQGKETGAGRGSSSTSATKIVPAPGGPRLSAQSARPRLGERARRGSLEPPAVIRRRFASPPPPPHSSRAAAAAAHGQATLWVTRDEGKTVLLVRARARRRDGDAGARPRRRRSTRATAAGSSRRSTASSGSVSSRHDWFYFVNGIEATRGAVDYRLRNGDVEWWDYRDWGASARASRSSSARFPSRSCTGTTGKVRPGGRRRLAAAARSSLAKLVHGRVAASAPSGANVLRLVGRAAALHGADAAERRGRVHVCRRCSAPRARSCAATATGTRCR